MLRATAETGVTISVSAMKDTLAYLGVKPARKERTARVLGLRELMLQMQGRLEQLEEWKAKTEPLLEKLAKSNEYLLENCHHHDESKVAYAC